MAFIRSIPDSVIVESIKLSFKSKMGNRGDGSDGSESQQLVGIIGQNAVLNDLHRPLMQYSNKSDGGTDLDIFGKKVDVKTMGRTVDPELTFVNNFIASQAKLNADAYIFTSLNKVNLRLTICGWLPKEELLNRATLYRKGEMRFRRDRTTFLMKADTYEIQNKDVYYKPKSWSDLMHEIHDWLDQTNDIWPF
jgi:hypothetical protein